MSSLDEKLAVWSHPADTDDPCGGAADSVRAALAWSPFARRLLEADPALLVPLLEGLRQPFDAAAMRACLAGAAISDEATLKQALRKLRQAVMLRVLVRDLAGRCGLDEVMQSMTALAEVAVNVALQFLEPWQRAVYGEPIGEESGAAQALIVVGMGKLGGGELNVSSDIDLIFAYDEDGDTSGPRRVSNHEYFAALGRRLIAAIGETTADGFVFRVDMRLRPYGDSGPLVGSLAMLEEYYQNQGREWERYAWIKGRVIAGPAEALQALLRPFVFRKYLDFGAFASMRDLKVQIKREVHRRDMLDNIKLGAGGIREIEFIAQVFQLIRGGRDPSLQIRPTLAVLARVRDKGLLPPEVEAELREAYVFLRNLEHRLQYVHDAQTQMLPTDDATRALIAAAMGQDDWARFMAALDVHRQRVAHHFAEVFCTQEADKPQASPLQELWLGRLAEEAAIEQLEAHGFVLAAQSWQRLQGTLASSRYQQLPAASRERFDALMPQVLRLAGTFANADDTLARLLNLLESICRRASYLALLAEYPQALEQVVKLVSASPWLAQYLAQHPILLDELLDTRTLYAPLDFTALADDLNQRLAAAAGDVERQMDLMRHFKHAMVFRLAAQDIAGKRVLESLSDDLSALADLLLQAVISTVWPAVPGRHRDAPRFAIIGYGKLGGKELGYASDLDIIFLYDDDAPDAGAVYARFAQRINSWLNSLTAAGQLYETDLRLRPDGASGLLVSSVAAFAEYQQHKAWTWEHQALTRARYCAGDGAVGAAFEQIRRDILCRARARADLRADVLAMRQKMHDGHPNHSERFDLKHDAGGIVDVEFIVQYLVLAHAAAHPALLANAGNIALLRIAAGVALIEPEAAIRVADAYRRYRSEQHAQRLQGVDKARADKAHFAAEIAAVRSLWQEVLGCGETGQPEAAAG